MCVCVCVWVGATRHESGWRVAGGGWRGGGEEEKITHILHTSYLVLWNIDGDLDVCPPYCTQGNFDIDLGCRVLRSTENICIYCVIKTEEKNRGEECIMNESIG